jgi:predicted transcriptional regulator
MVTDPKPLISDDLLHQVQEAAREQNREPAEVIEEAVGRYLASQRLARFAERAEARARAKGIREEDVLRLVDDVRRENEARGR